MNPLDIGLGRLHAQHIAQADFARPEDVVRHMGAMQAQDYAGAKWSIGLRTVDCAEKDVEQAVVDRKILRTWPQRGTIHFVVPEEVRWRLMLSTPRILAGARRRHENLGLTPSDFDKALNLFEKALVGDKQLSRPDMMQVLEAGGITAAGQRGYHILWYLAQTGHICFGPLQGKQPTFALLDEWAPKTAEISREEALHRLVEKYFASHGPATLQDLVWWSGLTMTEAKIGLELAKSALESVVVSDTTYHFARGLEPLQGPSTFLLPGFDEYILGYKDRSAVLPASHASKIVPGSNGVFMPTIIIDGQVWGTWKSTLKKQLDITHIPFTKPTHDVIARLEAVKKKYAAYLLK